MFRVRYSGFIVIGLCCLLGISGSIFSDEAAVGPDHKNPTLCLETRGGNIVIALNVDAAPAAVEEILRLAKGPLFSPAVTGHTLLDRAPGYYDGLFFERALKHHFLKTAIRPPVRAILIRTESMSC